MVPEYTTFIEPQDGLALLRIRSPKCVRTLFIASHRGRELDEKSLAFQAFCFDFFRNMVENRSQRHKTHGAQRGEFSGPRAVLSPVSFLRLGAEAELRRVG